ncbi:hypothetical protein [Streptococcus gordonii]|uniref:Helix-turn-helix type 11 domain-containing protein n=1 Tax=Streptococcus gordonii TaxID=1302 RepID=A0AB35FVG6_STRGN|nr:hypothetical protein [Streptococcus gordonii]QBX08299.1 hypothetical protein JavanS243_0011 [Streptococcus satellite phage Javan243]MBZ2128027.1 hypothetical protein [Streptococcus gordonii]MBZ2129721.1 hypothetical protein [Streptococcus gordonii]MBZ2147309.1 hypothetical protein [Streptococcus gordonii]RSJ41981.1 hypothetical protein D8819_06675 [Streptococcus gordonii]
MTLPPLPENYKRVLNLIKVGGENAITGAEIAKILKIERRAVQEIISHLITQYKIPIIGARLIPHSGYYIPASKAELINGVKPLEKQVQKEQVRLNVLLNADLESYKLLLKGADEYV